MLTATCDHSRPSPGSCSEAVPILASLPAPCSSSVPRPFAQPGGSPPTWGSDYEPTLGSPLAPLGHFGLASSHAVTPPPALVTESSPGPSIQGEPGPAGPPPPS